VETLTRRWRPGLEYIEKIDAMGGAVAAIEAGFMAGRDRAVAYAYAKAVEDGEKTTRWGQPLHHGRRRAVEIFPIDPRLAGARRRRTGRVRAERDQDAVRAALDDVAAAARGNQNLLVPMRRP